MYAATRASAPTTATSPWVAEPQLPHHCNDLSVPHTYQCPLRWADMDLLGHVNNVTYLDYVAEARQALFAGHSAGRASVTRHQVDDAPEAQAPLDAVAVAAHDQTHAVGLEQPIARRGLRHCRSADSALGHERDTDAALLKGQCRLSLVRRAGEEAGSDEFDSMEEAGVVQQGHASEPDRAVYQIPAVKRVAGSDDSSVRIQPKMR